MEIPEEVRVASSVRPGSVYLFAEETHTGDDPHFFVVLNHSPLKDEELILVNATSKIEKVRRRTAKFPGTLVEVTREEYSIFSVPISAFDGNEITKKTLAEIIKKLKERKLIQKMEMPIPIVERLRQAVIKSPQVEQRYKNLLIPPVAPGASVNPPSIS